MKILVNNYNPKLRILTPDVDEKTYRTKELGLVLDDYFVDGIHLDKMDWRLHDWEDLSEAMVQRLFGLFVSVWNGRLFIEAGKADNGFEFSKPLDFAGLKVLLVLAYKMGAEGLSVASDYIEIRRELRDRLWGKEYQEYINSRKEPVTKEEMAELKNRMTQK